MSSQERPETPAASAPEAGGVSPLITTHDDEPPRSTVSPVPPTPSSEGKRHLMGGRVTTVSSNGLPPGAAAAAAAASAAGGETVELSSSYHWSFVSMTSSAVAGCGVSSKQGLRPSMEDQHTALLGTAPIPARTGEQIGVVQDGIPFFAVYDGHGGQRCAEFLRENLHYYVLSRENLKADPEGAIKEGVRIAEQQFFEQEKTDESGSTAAMAMIVDNRLVIGNVGDTEIVLARDGHAHVMTKKHHPGTNLEEAKRVEGCGGRVFRGRVGHPFYNPALVSLAVSRAIGDAGFKREEFTNGRNSGITADADTCSTELTNTDEFFIIGCDGLWDVMNAEAAVRFCQQQLREGHESQEITEALVNKAIDLGSKDNVTVLLVLLRRTLSPSQTHAAVLGGTLNGTTNAATSAAAEASAEEEESARRLQLRKQQLLAAVAAASDKSAGLAPPAGGTTNSVTPRVLAETGTYSTSALPDSDPAAPPAAGGGSQ